MTRRRSVLVAEPWLAGSHRAWAEGLQANSTHEVSIVGLPGVLWRWRLLAGAVPLARLVSDHLERAGPPDVVMVSGLVDVASLLGLLRRSLPGGVPVVTYMHETQLLYPTDDGTVDQSATLANWRSWCASDVVVFNSEFHRSAVLDAMPAWFDRLPDGDQSACWDDVAARFVVLPVGIADRTAEPTPPEAPVGARGGVGSDQRAPIILWPHRWERDKRPDVFARALDRLSDAGLDFSVVLAGDEPVASAEKRAVLDRHGHRVIAVGPFDRSEYDHWLRASDIVVSCAEHEFFGVAVLEAMSAGCVPLLPDALAYPETVPDRFHEVALYEPGRFGTALVAAVENHAARRDLTADLAAELDPFRWSVLIDRYDQMFVEVDR